jgi:hypothetical protein
MDESLIIKTIRSYLSPRFHVSLNKEGENWNIDVQSPHKTHEVKVTVTTGELNKIESLESIGKIFNQAFIEAWE